MVGTSLDLKPSSDNNDINHWTSVIVDETALNSAYVDERANIGCLLELQEIGLDPSTQHSLWCCDKFVCHLPNQHQ